ncbi:MAG: hypothetical protein DME57_10570, partial [Verrucomicrobia bacterium]
RTGGDSRSEITFADLTITRLGENTVFTLDKSGRSVRLDSGTILLYAKKNSGGAEIVTKAVTVGITGTTVIFKSQPDSFDRLTVLEGGAHFGLNNFPDQSTDMHAGELLEVKAGMRKLPAPRRVDLRRIMRLHPLITNFPPLPSVDLIVAEMRKQNPHLPNGGNASGPPFGRPPPVGGFPQPTPVATFSPKQPIPTPKPTVAVTPGATVKPTAAPTVKPTPIVKPSPKPTPKKRFTPKKRRSPTPTPGQIIR